MDGRKAEVERMYLELRAAHFSQWWTSDCLKNANIIHQVSVIPGALHKEEFEAKKDSYKEGIIVLYCTIGLRSGKYAAALRAQGFDARNLKGSILSWTHEGGELEEPGTHAPTKRVHTYGEKWALAAEGYEPVYFSSTPVLKSIAYYFTDIVASWLPWRRSKAPP
eukprot:jgi/Chlat1/2985/Chrsp2S08917